MKAKEKAQELFDKFFKMTLYYQPHRKQYYINMVKMDAKKCALICCDEVIYNNNNTLTPEQYHSELNYWVEVKTEISNL